MYVDVYIEPWTKDGTKSFYLYTTSAHGVNRWELYANEVFINLINEKNGLWKDKKMRFIDGAWGEVRVKKSDIIDFIDKVDTEIGEESVLNMDKVKQLDDKINYALVCCES
jgi:hypothetical protein